MVKADKHHNDRVNKINVNFTPVAAEREKEGRGSSDE